LELGALAASLMAAALLALTPVAVVAHDSPEHVVESLSVEMGRTGTNATLLWRRATEYRALGRLAPATADLQQALALDPKLIPAWSDLARVQLIRSRPADALVSINRAFELAPDEAGRAPLRMVRAEVEAALGRPDAALADCERALSAGTMLEADWFLSRCQLQLRLGRYSEAAAGLKAGFDQTGSAVLEAEWIDALIDGGKPGEALELIEPRLAEARCQSSWLLRRGRARLASGDTVRARGDLNAAITEINGRLHPTQPDAALLAERGLASALLGDEAAARRDLAAARRRQADEATLFRLEAALRRLPDKEKGRAEARP
jgi:tetratricopeptide (TPR) repeat protein